MRISFVIGTLNEGENLRKTIENLQLNTQITEDYEIIVVDDGSTDGSSNFIGKDYNDERLRLYKTNCLGSANSKNFGAEKAKGDFLCFLDAHVLFPQGWLKPLITVLKEPSVGIVAPALSSWKKNSAKGYGMKWRNARLDMSWLPKEQAEPYPVPMVGLACMAFRRSFFEEIGGFDRGLRSYGTTDQEVCMRTWLLGYRVMMVPEVTVAHLFRSKFPYPVSWANTVHNKLRTMHTYFSPERLKRCASAIRALPKFSEGEQLFLKNNVEERKERFWEVRKFDDDWFFNRFAMNV